MTEEQLSAMTDEQIRARFRHAPAYYLQSKLEKKRSLEQRERRETACAEFWWRESLAEEEAPLPRSMDAESASLDIALPGLEILDAALSASDYLDAIPAEPDTTPDELPPQADLEAALDDCGNWPILSDSDPLAHAQPEPESDSEPGLEFALGFELDPELALDLVLEPGPEPDAELATKSELDLLLQPEPKQEQEPETEPEFEPQPELERRLKLVLESEPDLELVLESDPALELELASQQAPDAQSESAAIPDNVTVGDFGFHAPRTIRVVSVVMDRKRPYMVRIVGETTRLAS